MLYRAFYDNVIAFSQRHIHFVSLNIASLLYLIVHCFIRNKRYWGNLYHGKYSDKFIQSNCDM